MLNLAVGKEREGCGRSAFCRFESKILATGQGLKAFPNAISRPAGALLRRKDTRRAVKVGADRFIALENGMS